MSGNEWEAVSTERRWAHQLPEICWSLITNLMVLLGVLWWHWPAGNVYLLFWVENVILGVITVVKLSTSIPQGNPARTLFFIMHYGIFAVVHAAFVGIVAVGNGVSLSFWALGFPIVLIVIRYLADLVTVWFIGGQRRFVHPDQVFAAPYPRLIVLHIATLLGFFATLNSLTGPARHSDWLTVLGRWLADHGIRISGGAAVVALLMVLKSLSDVFVAGRGYKVTIQGEDEESK